MTTTGIVPFKTPEGQDELARRTRRLGQRHRTVLLLIDGRRTVDQVLALAYAAGVAETHYRDLLDMGLVALPADVVDAPTMPMPLHESEPSAPEAGPGPVLDVELPIGRADGTAAWSSPADSSTAPLAPDSSAKGEAELLREAPSVPSMPSLHHTTPPQEASPQPHATSAAQRPVEPPPAGIESQSAATNDSLLPSVQSLLPDSTLSDFGRLDVRTPHIDRPLEEAREILLRAVRTEAPVAGQLTLMKIKRAADRAELEALLDEVEARIARPRKMIAAAQTLRHVRHLLGMPTSTSFTML